MHIDKYLNEKQLEELQTYLAEALSAELRTTYIKNKELTLITREKDLLNVLTFLRDKRKCQFKMLIDICGVDNGEEAETRFEIVYHLLSLIHNMRVRLKVLVPEGQSISSVVSVFSNAGWYERETYDMFGITFEGNPDLRRLLTDYDFTDFPLRKDFPVEGKVEMFYDEELKRCVYRPTKLAQPYRDFSWQSPWEAVDKPYHLAEEDNAFDPAEFETKKGEGA